MASVTRFIERCLKLAVNEAKSAVDRPWNRTFLGFTLRRRDGFPRAIAAKAVDRFKQRVRELTRRNRGVGVKRMINDLNPPLRGWAGYFGFSERHETRDLDKRIRRRLRSAQARQWRTYRKRLAELTRRGVAATTARDTAHSSKGPWRLTISDALLRAFGTKAFRNEGFVFTDEIARA
jgi:RNA-directed DNA polymerase